MPYSKPDSDNIQHFVWLRQEMELDDPIHSFAENLAAEFLSGETIRSDVLQNLTAAVSMLVANLYRAHLRDPNLYVALTRSNSSFTSGAFNPIEIGVRAVRRGLSSLQQSSPRYIETKGGNNDRSTGLAFATRIRATRRLVVEIEDWLSTSDLPSETQPVTRNTLADNPNSVASLALFRCHELPIIRVRDYKRARGKTAPYLNIQLDEETRAMEARLDSFNAFHCNHHWTDLFVPDAEFRSLSNKQEAPEENAFGDGDERDGNIDLLFRRRLYRVFNNRSSHDGGRFYGGWWQGLPSRYRHFVTINGFTTAELDYSAIQLNMLYAMEGRPPPDDAYALKDFPTGQRKLLKTAFFKLVNSTGKMRAPKKDSLPKGWTWKRIIHSLTELHSPIANHFHSGIGIKLQRIDSDIAERVMLDMKAEGVLALPVHDSFIVTDGDQNRLRETMVEAYRKRMGQEIGVAADTTWLEKNLPADAYLLDELGVRFIDDFQADIEQKPEYELYRQRRNDFVKMKGEAWGHKYSFFR